MGYTVAAVVRGKDEVYYNAPRALFGENIILFGDEPEFQFTTPFRFAIRMILETTTADFVDHIYDTEKVKEFYEQFLPYRSTEMYEDLFQNNVLSHAEVIALIDFLEVCSNSGYSLAVT